MVVAPQSLHFQVKDFGVGTLYPFASDTAMEDFLKQGLQAGSVNPKFITLKMTAANESGRAAES